ncbi:hypothetical protein AB4144_29005, partial [Rhizobiaceae sp. 2RAB30]
MPVVIDAVPVDRVSITAITSIVASHSVPTGEIAVEAAEAAITAVKTAAAEAAAATAKAPTAETAATIDKQRGRSTASAQASLEHLNLEGQVATLERRLE